MSRPFVGCPRPQGRRCGTLGAMNLLTITYPHGLSAEDQSCLEAALKPFSESLDAQLLVLGNGMQAALTHDPTALHERLDRLALAIESLVAVNAALLERLPLPGEDEEPDAETGIPQPLSRPR